MDPAGIATTGKSKIPTRLVEKGGIGLVAYHLARRGIEFVQTTEGCPEGDIWIKDGRSMAALEVKTTTGDAWSVRVHQLRAAHFICFVRLHSAACWIMRTGTARAIPVIARQIAEGRKEFTVTYGQLPPDARDAWGVLSERVIRPPRQAKPRSGTKTVRRRLANGEIREYRYGSENVA